jgi:histone H3/H4
LCAAANPVDTAGRIRQDPALPDAIPSPGDVVARVSPFRRIEAAMIISKSKTKEAVTQCNVSGEFYDAPDAKVNELIKKAEQRAIANGRKTVRPQDL